MATYSKLKFSGSTDGRPILIAATATPGTTIHTAHATDLDEVWLWVSNTSTNDTALTVQWGGTTNPNDHLVTAYNIPANSQPIPIAVGIPVTGSVLVRAFCTNANVAVVTGFVNRITP